MDANVPIPVPAVVAAATPSVVLCPECHQPSPVTAYYCANCGKKLSEPPLSTSIGTQIWIYAFGIILPVICYLAIKYWPAFKYARSSDETTKLIGFVAIALMLISTVITFWLGAVWVNQAIQSSLSSVNSMNLGGF